MDKRFNRHKTRRFFVFFPLMIIVVFAMGGVVMFLWNAILPELLGVKAIGYWQSLGLLALCKILFGGFFGPRGRHGGRRGVLRQRLAGMSDEERDKFRQEWKKREECKRCL